MCFREGQGGGGSLAFPLVLNERGKAGGTQCVVVLRGHVVSISEDRASGTRMESGWCRGECRLCEVERMQDVWISDMRRGYEILQ